MIDSIQIWHVVVTSAPAMSYCQLCQLFKKQGVEKVKSFVPCVIVNISCKFGINLSIIFLISLQAKKCMKRQKYAIKDKAPLAELMTYIQHF